MTEMPSDVPPPPPPGVPGAASISGEPWTPTGAIGYGWKTMTQSPESIGVLLVGAIGSVAFSLIGSLFLNVASAAGGDSEVEVAGLVVYVVMQLANIPVQAFFTMNMTRYALKLVRGEPAGFEDLFRMDFGPFLSLLAAMILVGLGAFLGVLLCIVPGVILAIAWCLTTQFVVDRNLGPIEAMTQSWSTTKGRWGELFVFFLLVFGVIVLGILACCVGVLISQVIVTIAYAYNYLRFTNQPIVARV